MKFKPIKSLKNSLVLISNDDGINSRGLKVLEEEIRKSGAEVIAAAPLFERSGSSHAVTAELTDPQNYSNWQDLPRRIEKFDDSHYGIDGTPADCVHIALSLLCKTQKPDLVVSGINLGRNLAEDITYSGTIGVAVEGLLHGIFSVAFSQQTEGREPDWEIAQCYTAPLLEKLAAQSWDINTLMSINYPNTGLDGLKGITPARHGERRFPDKKLLNSLWPDDYLALKDHNIVITPISIDYTDYKALERLSRLF